MKKLLIVIVALVFMGCATSMRIQNPIEKARTQKVLDKMEKSYGKPKYRFTYVEIDDKLSMIEYYYYRLDDNNIQVVKVVNGVLQTGDNIETD